MLVATPAQHLRGAVNALAPHLRKRHARDRLRQGHRARHAQIHDRRDRASPRPRRMPAILSGPSFADDVARGLPTAVTLAAQRRSACGRAGAGAGLADLPALSHDRRARRRDRRRGQERAGDRRRHRGRQKARRVGAGRADHARLFRTRPPRPRLRRAQRDHDGPLGPWRPDPDLLEPAIAQFRARDLRSDAASNGRRASSPRASSPRRC